jgi:hypothetical protein
VPRQVKLVPPRTVAEEELLAELLVAVRQAVRTGHQLSITIDPHVDGSGVHASVMFDPSGYDFTIEGRFRARRRAAKPT